MSNLRILPRTTLQLQFGKSSSSSSSEEDGSGSGMILREIADRPATAVERRIAFRGEGSNGGTGLVRVDTARDALTGAVVAMEEVRALLLLSMLFVVDNVLVEDGNSSSLPLSSLLSSPFPLSSLLLVDDVREEMEPGLLRRRRRLTGGDGRISRSEPSSSDSPITSVGLLRFMVTSVEREDLTI